MTSQNAANVPGTARGADGAPRAQVDLPAAGDQLVAAEAGLLNACLDTLFGADQAEQAEQADRAAAPQQGGAR